MIRVPKNSCKEFFFFFTIFTIAFLDSRSLVLSLSLSLIRSHSLSLSFNLSLALSSRITYMYNKQYL